MLRVLTLSTLFPNAAQPTLGVFVERQALGLAALPDVEVRVVSPVGLPPWPLSRHPHYAARAALAEQEQWKGLPVWRPAYRVWGPLGQAGSARRMAAALLPGLRRLRAEFPFDVIDAQFFWPDGPAAARLAHVLGVPFSIKARGADIHHWGRPAGTRGQIVEAAAAADGLLAVSDALAGDMAALGIARDKIRTHCTGVDLDRFVPVDRMVAKARLGVSGMLLVTAGALIPRKGQALVLEALRAIPGATLFLVGDGPDRRALERQVRAAGIGARVRFLGNRPHADLPGLLAAADALVLPSSSEGLANVWVEALACGTPIVISDVGGAREVVDRPEAGRLVARDPAVIAAAVRALIAAPPAAAAVRAAAERFSWDRNARELRDHLAALVEGDRAVRAA